MKEKFPNGSTPEKNISCEIDDIFYESVKNAALKLNISTSIIYYRLSSDKYKNYKKIFKDV